MGRTALVAGPSLEAITAQFHEQAVQSVLCPYPQKRTSRLRLECPLCAKSRHRACRFT